MKIAIYSTDNIRAPLDDVPIGKVEIKIGKRTYWLRERDGVLEIEMKRGTLAIVPVGTSTVRVRGE